VGLRVVSQELIFISLIYSFSLILCDSAKDFRVSRAFAMDLSRLAMGYEYLQLVKY